MSRHSNDRYTDKDRMGRVIQTQSHTACHIYNGIIRRQH